MSAANHRQAPIANEAPMAERACRLSRTRSTRASTIASTIGYAAHTARTKGLTLWSAMIASTERLQKISTLTTTIVTAARWHSACSE